MKQKDELEEWQKGEWLKGMRLSGSQVQYILATMNYIVGRVKVGETKKRWKAVSEALEKVRAKPVDMFSDIVANTEGAFVPDEIDLAKEDGYNQAVADLNAKIEKIKEEMK